MQRELFFDYYKNILVLYEVIAKDHSEPSDSPR